MSKDKAENAPGRLSEYASVLVASVLLLFFVQLASVWFENIYRIALVKVGMGREVYALFIPCVVLPVLCVKGKGQRAALVAALVVLLAARVSCPVLNITGRVIAGGLGVAAFLAIISHVLAGVGPFRRSHLGVGAVLAVLLSVLFRSWGSSLDASLSGSGVVIGYAMIGIAMMALCVTCQRFENVEEAADTPVALLPFLLVPALFANLAVIYLVLSSPAVLSGWTGQSYMAGVILLAVSFTGAAFFLGRVSGAIPRWCLFFWNVLFVACLVTGIRLNTTELPSSETIVAVVTPAGWAAHLPLYLMLLLSPVIVFNIAAIGESCTGKRPRRYLFAAFLGFVLFTFIVFLMICGNVWGYSGSLGAALRNRFHVPFCVAGFGMLLSCLARRPTRTSGVFRVPIAAVALLLGLASVVGVWMCVVEPAPADAAAKSLKVLTYNMQQGSGAASHEDYAAQLALIRSVNADIIGLQESDTPRPSGGNVDAVRYFADALGYHFYYGPNTISGTFGTAILSRFPLEHPRTIFSYSDVDETGTAVVEFTAGGRRIAFLCNHPAGSTAAHRAHVDAVLAEAAQYEHVIAVGDFNFRPASEHFARVTQVLRDSWADCPPDRRRLEPNVPGKCTGDARIDHIFVSPDFNVVQACYIPAPASQTDHPAYWAVIAWD